MRVSTVSEMRGMDAEAIGRFGIPEEILMENAGLAAVAVAERILARGAGGRVRGRCVVVLCGTGNNGGDGLVVARLLHSRGESVRVILVGEPGRYRGAASRNYETARKLGLTILEARGAAELHDALSGAQLVVDAIFGTGLSRGVEGLEREAVLAVNRSGDAGVLVLSLDIPSGVNGDTGAINGVAVRAGHTVTFGLPKLGNLLYPGYSCCGKLWVSHISFPPELYDTDSLSAAVNAPAALPPRRQDGHKGSFGDALFVAGSRSYLGAPVLAALAHLRSGGGYARLAVPSSLVPALAQAAREVVFAPQPESSNGSISRSGIGALIELALKADAVVVGPGLSLDAEAGEVALELIRSVDRPMLVDGDGLTHLARSPESAARRSAPLVLTPHPGELARLLGRSVADVASNRLDSLREAVERYSAVVVSKGAHTLVGTPNGKVFINLSGNSGMATPGSGDVLAGAITAMLGLGLAVTEAARTGVFAHGLAGDFAARELGEDGITASDILARLPAAVRELREGGVDPARAFCGKIEVV